MDGKITGSKVLRKYSYNLKVSPLKLIVNYKKTIMKLPFLKIKEIENWLERITVKYEFDNKEKKVILKSPINIVKG